MARLMPLQGGKKSKLQSDAWEALISDADTYPGETRVLAITGPNELKLYGITRLTPEEYTRHARGMTPKREHHE